MSSTTSKVYLDHKLWKQAAPLQLAYALNSTIYLYLEKKKKTLEDICECGEWFMNAMQ